jgi:hypothetical protein
VRVCIAFYLISDEEGVDLNAPDGGGEFVHLHLGEEIRCTSTVHKHPHANPLPTIVNHIASEGLVPIVCTDARADTFTTHAALVQITAPFDQAVPEYTVIVLLDDIHLFTQTWYYSALSYPMLNDRLSTIFELVSPTTPLPLQRRLLLPFTQVKGLYHMDLANYSPEVCTELRKGMSVPIPTLQASVESSLSFLEAGDAALATNDPQTALDCYTNAFKAIHILITHRTRRILADTFFHATIPSGIFAHQSGSTVRVVLRLKLVSRFILTYLKLHQPREAAFWGLRSIRIMRESMDVEYEDFLSEFVGGEDVRMIYVRTGIAVWIGEQDGWSEGPETSERLWGLARKFFKGRGKEGVRRELGEFGVGSEGLELFEDENGDGSVSAQAGSGDEAVL